MCPARTVLPPRPTGNVHEGGGTGHRAEIHGNRCGTERKSRREVNTVGGTVTLPLLFTERRESASASRRGKETLSTKVMIVGGKPLMSASPMLVSLCKLRPRTGAEHDGQRLEVQTAHLCSLGCREINPTSRCSTSRDHFRVSTVEALRKRQLGVRSC